MEPVRSCERPNSSNSAFESEKSPSHTHLPLLSPLGGRNSVPSCGPAVTHFDHNSTYPTVHISNPENSATPLGSSNVDKQTAYFHSQVTFLRYIHILLILIAVPLTPYTHTILAYLLLFYAPDPFHHQIVDSIPCM